MGNRLSNIKLKKSHRIFFFSRLREYYTLSTIMSLFCKKLHTVKQVIDNSCYGITMHYRLIYIFERSI